MQEPIPDIPDVPQVSPEQQQMATAQAQQTIEQSTQPEKGKSWLVWLVVTVLGAMAAVAIGYLFFQDYILDLVSRQTNLFLDLSSAQRTQEQDVTSWQEYQFVDLGVLLLLPKDWSPNTTAGTQIRFLPTQLQTIEQSGRSLTPQEQQQISDSLIYLDLKTPDQQLPSAKNLLQVDVALTGQTYIFYTTNPELKPIFDRIVASIDSYGTTTSSCEADADCGGQVCTESFPPECFLMVCRNGDCVQN